MSVNAVSEREERPPLVRFERRAIEDKPATLKAGHVVYKDIDYVLVTPPYSKDCYVNKAEIWFDGQRQNVRNGRTPPQWLEYWEKIYDHFKKGEEAPLNGTSVKNWPAISQGQCKTLLAANILTIEDLAAANDEGIRRLGMGGMELRNKAKAYLQASKDTSPLVLENAALKKQISILEGQIKALSDKISREDPVEDIKIEDILEESLVDQYIAKFGKKPHHLMKEDTIRAKLNES